MMKLVRIALAIVMASAIVAVATLSQLHFKAGSIPDLLCESVLLPGKLFATPFHDRGTASPEFLWRSRVFTAILFSVVAYPLLRRRGRFSD